MDVVHGVVSINANGTMSHDPGNDGTWECTDRARGRATLRWRLNGYVNQLALSADGRALSSTDPSQSYVTARKVDGPRPAEAPRRSEPEVPKAKAPESPRRADAEGPKAQPPGSPPTRPEPAKPEPPEAPRDTPPPPGVSAVPCSGTACGDLAPDASQCKVTVTGTKPLKVRTYSGERISETTSVTPGRVLDLAGCATLTRIEAVYQTETFAAAPKGDAAGPGPCSGDVCINVRIMTTDGCVWIRSSALDAVRAELRLQGEPVTMTLEKPDLAKAVKVSDTRGEGAQAARQAAARKRLDKLRQKGHSLRSKGRGAALGSGDGRRQGQGEELARCTTR